MNGLAASGLSLDLGGQAVLSGIDVTFAPGRVTAILGPNGAGKSTLLACLAGLQAPDGGIVTLEGRARAMFHRNELARHIGFLPQAADLHWPIEAGRLVALGRFPHRGRWGLTARDRDAIDRAMVMTDVSRFANRPVDTLSGGERARVLLARVLAGEPDWLLADEPLANLDPAHQLDTLDCLRMVAVNGAGVVVVLHDLNHAARVADDVVMMANGRVIASGTANDVLVPQVIEDTFGVSTHAGTTKNGRRFLVPMARVE
jgi:iron complex transport system ATP-binding protein